MPERQGNNPKRRIVPMGAIDRYVLDRLLRKACYTGSPHHKRVPADYDFHPPANQRPNKSLCDGNGPSVAKEAAASLFRQGIKVRHDRRRRWRRVSQIRLGGRLRRTDIRGQA